LQLATRQQWEFQMTAKPLHPHKRRIESVTDDEMTMIENRLKHRPRKRLGFKTPD
jgi:IS30 family transposase